MKRIFSVFALALVFVLGACGEKGEIKDPVVKPEVGEQMSAIEVLYSMFDEAGIPIFETISTYDEKQAENALSFSVNPAESGGTYDLKNFESGVQAQPPHLLSTSMVIVLELSDNKNIGEITEKIRGMMSSGVCVRPEEHSVYTVNNGNYVAYISALMVDDATGEEVDYGVKLKDAFMSMDFASEDIKNETATDIIINKYIELGTPSNLDLQGSFNPLFDVNPGNPENDYEPDFTIAEDAIKSVMYMASELDFSTPDSVNEQFMAVIEVSASADMAVVKEALEARIAAGSMANYRFENVTMTTEGNFITISNI